MKSIFSNATSRHGSPLSHPSYRRSVQAQDSRASNFHHPKSKIQNPKFGGSAFSLTEVVIAMGVAAVAFTSIIALFPLGLNMSKESYEETQAALLAQTIFSDFKDNLTGTNTFSSGYLLQIGAKNSPTNFPQNTPANYTNITSFPSIHYVAYKQTPNAPGTLNQETMLRPFTNSTSENAFYTKGTSEALVIAKINLSYCFPLQSTNLGPIRADITIETPGNLPTEKRKQLIFTGGF
jgi:type II secretory pathway pseudopilin PulG